MKKILTTKQLISIILLVKVIILGIIAVAYYFVPFNYENYHDNFLIEPDKPVSLEAAYTSWDAQHYLKLSQDGYKLNQRSNAFYPLYPILIKSVTFVVRSPVIAAFIVSNLASALAIVVFYKFVLKYFDSEKAFWSFIFLLAFPTSFYFSLIYSESLFFLLAILFFASLMKDDYRTAAIFGFLLPLTRPTGILIIIPFGLYFLINKYKKSKFKFSEYFDMNMFYVFSPLLGLGFYFYLMQAWAGTFKAGFRAQGQFISNNSIFNILKPWVWVRRNLLRGNWAIHGFQNSIIDRIFFFAYAYLLWPMRKIKHPVLFVYALVFGLVPGLSGTLMSFTRYLLIVFPIFIALAYLLKSNRSKVIVAGGFGILQVIFLVMHSLSYWVA